MSVDAQRLYDVMFFVMLLWSAPLQIAIAIYFLWDVLGIAVLAGLVILAATMPFNVLLARRSKKVQVR